MSINMETRPSQTIAGVTDRCPLEEMPQAMGRNFGRLMAVLTEQGAVPAGPPMTLYPEPMTPDGPVVFVSAIPVQAGTTGDGDVEITEIPEGPIVVFMHEGPYAELGRTYGLAHEQMREAGLLVGGPPCEIYLNDPGDTPPERLLTRIEFPVFEPD